MMDNKFEPKKVVQICMPEFSFIVLLLSIFYWRKDKIVIHYNILPRYLRGISRLLNISHENIVAVLSTITRLTINKIKHGDEVPDYPYLHLKTMEMVTTITDELLPEVKKKLWTKWLEKLLGERASLAYTAKYLSQYQLFTYIMPTVACYRSTNTPDNFIVVWNAEWPSEWNNLIYRNLAWIKFEFFKWPLGYLFLQNLFIKIVILIKLLAIIFSYIIRKGITFKTISKEHFKIITEFIDPKRLNSTAYDADYWVDGLNVTKNDILFFLTNKQKRILTKDGYTVTDIKKLFQEKGYKLTILDDLPYSLSALSFLFSSYFGIMKNIFALNSPFLSQTFFMAWTEYLEFAPLFLHFSSNNFIYLTFPNGHASVRYDDAVITGLCRKHGVKSVGCQTRIIYANNFEYCFDCFDIYLSWGMSWNQISGEMILFIDKVIIVGCIYLDYLLHNYRKYLNTNEIPEQKKSLTVSIFPSDISDDHHYTKNYTKSLLMNCIKLAGAFPNITFRVKSKDPSYTNTMLNDKVFYKAYSAVKNNFSFVDHSRYDYAEILFSSDIVIAIGFTTPGFEGLMLNKRAIYYSELKCGGQVFKHLPFFVATNLNELTALFNRALNDYNIYSKANSTSLDKLDPFRDGQALKRINYFLFDGIK